MPVYSRGNGGCFHGLPNLKISYPQILPSPHHCYGNCPGLDKMNVSEICYTHGDLKKNGPNRPGLPAFSAWAAPSACSRGFERNRPLPVPKQRLPLDQPGKPESFHGHSLHPEGQLIPTVPVFGYPFQEAPEKHQGHRQHH